MVLAKDHADGITKSLYVDLREDIGQWIAAACKTATGPIVLTIKPPDQYGCEITDAETFPGEATHA